MYTEQDVKRDTLKYFSGDELASKVWIEKYALRDLNGNLLEKTPADMHVRLAKEFSRIENKYPNPMLYDEIEYLLLNFKYFIPGGSVMFGVGNDYSFSSLGNCFVIGNEADSYGGIFQTDQEQVQLMKRRGGVGHDISHLRSKGSLVSNSARSSTGAVSFMPRYSNSTREVAQDGRRGALMLSMNITHPDIEDFIMSKDDLTKITGANISVKITDKFMNAISNNIGDREMTTWKKLIHQAWKTAEPGVLFWDKIIQNSPADCYADDGFKSVSTNPCGEVPLSPYDSCRLGSINLYSFVNEPFTDRAVFDWHLLEDVAYNSQRLMDNIVDLEAEKIDRIIDKITSDKEPLAIKMVELNLWAKIKTSLLNGRRTGLGMLGLADAGAALGLQYGTDKFMYWAEDIAKTIAISSYKSSVDMAMQRGAFPVCDPDLEKNPFLDRIYLELDGETQLNWGLFGRRNIANLSIAPTGTLAILAQVSSGIEPVFNLVYNRKRKITDGGEFNFTDATGDKWFEYEVRHKPYQKWVDELTVDQLMVHPVSPYDEATANEIDPVSKIKMQGRIQRWVDHSISITHNLPSTTTEEEVSNIYLQAWKEGCKGVTIYRDSCRDGVLTTKKSTISTFTQHDAPKRPKELECDVFVLNIKHKQFLVVVGLMEGKPYEVFAVLHTGKILINEGFIRKASRGKYDLYDKNGYLYLSDITSEMTQVEESTTRLISWGLRHGAGITFLVEQLSKVEGNGFQDFAKVIIRVLKKYIKDGIIPTGHTCENCGSTSLEYRDGCLTCMNCGNSKCG